MNSATPSRQSAGYKWIALGVLMLVGLTNYMDRLSISILQVPIKADLRLSDTQLGAITGLSFSLVYTLAAIPIARYADRRSPKFVIIGCLVAWNVLTILCGFAHSFLALALLRMGVAIGEAGCGPASHSMLSAYFPPEQRGRAIALWQMVFPLGSLIGIFGSGLLSAALGWRMTFIVLGSVGLLVALPALLLRMPTRFVPRPERDEYGRADGVKLALRELLSLRSYRLLLLGGFLAAIPLNAVLNWNAPFYARTFGLALEQTSIIVAVTAGLGGAAGMLSGGFMADWLGQRDRRWYCWLPAAAVAISPAFATAQFLIAPTPILSMVSGFACSLLLNLWIPPQAAVGQLIVRSSNRALSAACILVSAGLGAALGPFLAGMLSDLLAQGGGDQGRPLALSVVAVSLLAWPAAALFLWAGRYLTEDLRTSSDQLPVDARAQ